MSLLQPSLIPVYAVVVSVAWVVVAVGCAIVYGFSLHLTDDATWRAWKNLPRFTYETADWDEIFGSASLFVSGSIPVFTVLFTLLWLLYEGIRTVMCA